MCSLEWSIFFFIHNEKSGIFLTFERFAGMRGARTLVKLLKNVS